MHLFPIFIPLVAGGNLTKSVKNCGVVYAQFQHECKILHPTFRALGEENLSAR
ncbi:MAG: hypothetical protein G01um101472_71 [Parcubacteria group bacterium Gr01-1014_72]|nr:MAG: hypothetical protein G01um101472_71 [Parcubacteria group bacterium Gr01-1014_72]